MASPPIDAPPENTALRAIVSSRPRLVCRPLANDGITSIHDKASWETFVTAAVPSSFLQSWSWGEFQESLGRRIWRLGAIRDGRLAGVGLLVKVASQLGDHLYCPRGPLGERSDPSALDSLISAAIEIARAEGCAFLRLDPALAEVEGIRDFFARRGFKRAVSSIQSDNVRILPLGASEEELLSAMRDSTRYGLRQERGRGITVESSDRPEDANRFVDLLEATARRKRFVTHPREYYTAQFRILSRGGMEKIFIARRGDTVLSMAMIVYYGRTGWYLYGASNAHERGSLGCLLQWEAIREAKRRGCDYYNFLGTLPEQSVDPGHPWYGFSHFKRGFGGFEEAYIRAQDLPLSSRYWLYKSAEKSRRWLRGVRRRLSPPEPTRAHPRP
jgi:lipid II:glycine glycyltransferase (peptidoglycan interpeptide bridge formation enzyme)